jgi:hypothetical protein
MPQLPTDDQSSMMSASTDDGNWWADGNVIVFNPNDHT